MVTWEIRYSRVTRFFEQIELAERKRLNHPAQPALQLPRSLATPRSFPSRMV